MGFCHMVELDIFHFICLATHLDLHACNYFEYIFDTPINLDVKTMQFDFFLILKVVNKSLLIRCWYL